MDASTVTQRLANLLPNGAAWIKAAGTNLWATLSLFAPALSRLFGDIDTYKAESFPTSTNQNLDVWQASVGLPDPAYAGVLSFTQQRNQMVARLSANGGQSIAYFVRYAATLGYTIRIAEFAVPRAGLAKAGVSRANGVGFDHTWAVNVVSGSQTAFRAGDRVGNRLGAYPDISLLVHEFNRVKPAQTFVEYNIVSS